MTSHRVIRATSGPLEGEEFVIRETLRIGRAGDLAVQLLGLAVSRRHAELRVESDGSTTLTDLQSKNGTYVQGERIHAVTLGSGDSFEIGNASFRFEVRDGAAPEPADDLRLNLMSGPAEDETAIHERPATITIPVNSRPTTLPGAGADEPCRDPLHATARTRGWKFCPACGAPP